MKIISHNFQSVEVQTISDTVAGTSQLIALAPQLNEPVLFCGVLYMAEDLVIMSSGKIDVFIPEVSVRNNIIIEPRCPMEKHSLNTIMSARNEKPNYMLAYINMSAIMKAYSDVVYNGTDAVRVIADLGRSNNKLRVSLIGDRNVNHFIAVYCQQNLPNIEIIPAVKMIYCPVHTRINVQEFISQWNRLRAKWNSENTGMSLHSEVSKELIDFGLDNGAYIGGTTGMTELLSNSTKPAWFVATVEPFVERLRTFTRKEIISPGIRCPHMEFTQPQKVKKALEIILNGGPVADIVFRNEYEPYYDIYVHRRRYVIKRGDFVRIPAVRLAVDRVIRERAKRSLAHLLSI